MIFSAIQKFTLLDYPGKTACIAFTPGCNFRCGYCHNPEFVLPEKIQKIQHSFIEEEVLMNFLDKRKGLLDGVVISGGEPTILYGLTRFMARIKEAGFLVKLDTNGNRPEVIKQALDEGVVDYIAMDLKTTPDAYTELVGGNIKSEHIRESIAHIMDSNIEYEFRSTILKEIHKISLLKEMALEIENASAWYLQQFRSQKTLDPTFAQAEGFSEEEMRNMASQLNTFVQKIDVRI